MLRRHGGYKVNLVAGVGAALSPSGHSPKHACAATILGYQSPHKCLPPLQSAVTNLYHVVNPGVDAPPGLSVLPRSASRPAWSTTLLAAGQALVLLSAQLARLPPLALPSSYCPGSLTRRRGIGSAAGSGTSKCGACMNWPGRRKP